MLDTASPWWPILVLILGGYVTILRYTWSQEKKHREDKDEELRDEVEGLERKLEAQSIKLADLAADMRLQNNKHEHLNNSFTKIESSMVTKADLDGFRRGMQDTLQAILFELKASPKRLNSQQFPSPFDKGK